MGYYQKRSAERWELAHEKWNKYNDFFNTFIGGVIVGVYVVTLLIFG